MKRKWIRVLSLAMTLSMVLGVVLVWPMAGSAAEMVKLEDPCSLTAVYPEKKEENEEFVEDMETAEIVVDVYPVAEAVANEGYDGYHYDTLLQPYDQLFTSDSEVFGSYLDGEGNLDMDKADETFWAELAQATAKLVLGSLLEGEGESVQTPTPVDTILVGDPNEGTVDVHSGLYLLIPHGKDLENYASVNEEGKVVTIAYSQHHGYAFEPMLISLPNKEAYEYGEDDIWSGTIINTGNPGDWIYNAQVTLKAERMNGALEILKTLPVYESANPATFVFRVEAVSPTGDKVYDDVLALTFTEAGQKRLLIDNLPAGSEVTVEEIYSGSSYTQKQEVKLHYVREDGEVMEDPESQTGSRVTAVIGAARRVVVEFENEYDYRRTGGHGITNHFSYEGGWNLTQYPDNAEGAEGTTVPGNPAPGTDRQPEND